MKDYALIVLVVVSSAAAVLFAGYEWGKSSARVRIVQTTTVVPVEVVVPGRTGRISDRSNPSLGDTARHTFEDTVITASVWTIPHEGVWTLDYAVKPQKIDTFLVKRDSISYIEREGSWTDNWYYVPLSILVYEGARAIIKGR